MPINPATNSSQNSAVVCVSSQVEHRLAREKKKNADLNLKSFGGVGLHVTRMRRTGPQSWQPSRAEVAVAPLAPRHAVHHAKRPSVTAPCDWHCINFGVSQRCKKKKKKEEVEFKLGESKGAVFVSHLCSLCCAPLPRGCA